jgi:hypothetical protein
MLPVPARIPERQAVIGGGRTEPTKSGKREGTTHNPLDHASLVVARAARCTGALLKQERLKL